MKKLDMPSYEELGIASEFPIKITDEERLDWLLDDDTRVVIELVYKEGEKIMLDYLESREDIDRAIRSNK